MLPTLLALLPALQTGAPAAPAGAPTGVPDRAAIPAGAVAPAEPPARVELLEGRASLARADGVSELERGGRELWVEGPAYLELAPKARVALRWNATASLVVHGPAVLEWAPLEGSTARLEWHVEELGEAHFEVRRGPVRLSFPGSWSATLESGAGSLVGLPGGGVEWRHDAGLPILLAAPHARGAVRPPRVVLAGAWLRLRPGSALPEAVHGSAARVLDPYAREGAPPASPVPVAPWQGFSWPWEAAGPEPAVGPGPRVQGGAGEEPAAAEEPSAGPAVEGAPAPASREVDGAVRVAPWARRHAGNGPPSSVRRPGPAAFLAGGA